MMNREYTVVVDLAEGTLRMAAAYAEHNGAIHIAAYAAEKSRGVRRGRIENINEVEEALKRAVEKIEAKIGGKVTRAYCAIAGEFVYMVQHEETIDVTDPKGIISSEDYDRLYQMMQKVKVPAGYQMLDQYMQSTSANGKVAYKEKEMLGVYEKKVGACYNFILCENDAAERVQTLFAQRNIEIKRLLPSMALFGESVISREEMEGGVAVVDLGKGKTNVAIYYRAKLCYSISIPIGAEALNRDLEALKINERYIEDIKCEHGCAVADRAELKLITAEGRTPNEMQRIPLYNVAIVIEERMKSIVKFVEREIRTAGYEQMLTYGVVLCGGGAHLKYVAQLFNSHISAQVRVAEPSKKVTPRTAKNYGGPEFATLTGAMMRALLRDSREEVPKPCVEFEMPAEEQGGQQEEQMQHEGHEAQRSQATATQTDAAAEKRWREQQQREAAQKAAARKEQQRAAANNSAEGPVQGELFGENEEPLERTWIFNKMKSGRESMEKFFSNVLKGSGAADQEELEEPSDMDRQG